MPSQRQAKREPVEHAISERDALYVRLVACGHGDTVLMHVPGGQWFLVDCNLPGEEKLEQFYDLARQLGMDRLDGVFLTHPHSDHFAGMAEVLSFFTEDGRSVGFYCDSGDWLNTFALVEERQSARVFQEYVKLINRVAELVNSGTIGLHCLDEDPRPFRVKDCSHPVHLVPVPPKASSVAGPAEGSSRGGQVTRSVRSMNELCVIFVLQISGDEDSFQMLLGSDAKPDAMRTALSFWKDHEKNARSGLLEFDVIKVPHHGSLTGHLPKLCDAKRKNVPGVAAISCGTRWPPARSVIEDYRNRGWNVLATEIAQPSARPNRLIEQFDRSRPRGTDAGEEWETVRRDIEISWTQRDGVRWPANHPPLAPPHFDPCSS